MSAYLLDTHALIWWMQGDARLPMRARVEIESAEATIFASAVSAYEIAFKHTAGKLAVASRLLANYETDLAQVGLSELPISTRHALAAGQLELSHRDPFDRLLIAQAKIERLTLISNERLFDAFDVDRLWD